MAEPIPNREPDRLERYQLTCLDGNNNKFWVIKVWDMGGHCVQQTEWGRVGNAPQTKIKRVSRYQVDSLIASKERKGYKRLDLKQSNGNGHTHSSTKTGDVDVDWLIDQVHGEANSYINSYLNTTVDQLSHYQIARGRDILRGIAHMMLANKPVEATDYGLLDAVEEYYCTIPTKLPSRINPVQVARELISDMHEQEERLDQLDAAITTREKDIVRTVTTSSALDILGADVRRVPSGSHDYEMLAIMVRRRPSRIYEINIPGERSIYQQRGIPLGNYKQLIHGTRGGNVRHILPTGLIIPSHAANGSLYGRGIYFADDPQKSLNYTGGHMKVLFIADVSLGNIYQSRNYIKAPPSGYNSVLGEGAFKEYIVYNTWQQSIRYLVIM